LGPVDAVIGPPEKFSIKEVKEAIGEAKSGKAAGPSGVMPEMLKASGDVGVQWITDLFNAVVSEGKMPAEWCKSLLVNVYKGKGDALECGSYRGIKLLEQVMKVLERVVEKRVRCKVDIDDMQFGFRPGRGTTDAIFIVRQVQEKYLAKKRELWMAFVDLEKAFDRVPRDVVWWALRLMGVEEWIVQVIQAMYAGATTAVKINNGESTEFEVKVGVHQGSVLSPLLFIIVLEALSREFRVGVPWELFYADDLVLIAETEELLCEQIEKWKLGMEAKGLRVNIGKTKVMKCHVRSEREENMGKYPCGVCKSGVGINSIFCTGCSKWIHKKCSGVQGKLAEDAAFRCVKCEKGEPASCVKSAEINLSDGSKIELVNKLGDMIGSGGGAEEASRCRVRCAWSKFRELQPILTEMGVSLRLKGKFYKTCVQSVLVYGSETWATKVEDMKRLERTERAMVRWISGVTLKDRKSNEELRDQLGIECVSDIVTRARLRWYGHLERKNSDDCVAACRVMKVVGVRGKGRGRKTWDECVSNDMKKFSLTEEMAQD